MIYYLADKRIEIEFPNSFDEIEYYNEEVLFVIDKNVW